VQHSGDFSRRSQRGDSQFETATEVDWSKGFAACRLWWEMIKKVKEIGRGTVPRRDYYHSPQNAHSSSNSKTLAQYEEDPLQQKDASLDYQEQYTEKFFIGSTTITTSVPPTAVDSTAATLDHPPTASVNESPSTAENDSNFLLNGNSELLELKVETPVTPHRIGHTESSPDETRVAHIDGNTPEDEHSHSSRGNEREDQEGVFVEQQRSNVLESPSPVTSPSVEMIRGEDGELMIHTGSSSLSPPVVLTPPSQHDNLPPIPPSPFPLPRTPQQSSQSVKRIATPPPPTPSAQLSTPQLSRNQPQLHQQTPRASSIGSYSEALTPSIPPHTLQLQLKDLSHELMKTKEEVHPPSPASSSLPPLSLLSDLPFALDTHFILFLSSMSVRNHLKLSGDHRKRRSLV
jgi:hypothetical protein